MSNFKVGDKVRLKNGQYHLRYEVIGIIDPPMRLGGFNNALSNMILRRKDDIIYANSNSYELFAEIPPTVWVVYTPGDLQPAIFYQEPSLLAPDQICRKINFNETASPPPKDWDNVKGGRVREV